MRFRVADGALQVGTATESTGAVFHRNTRTYMRHSCRDDPSVPSDGEFQVIKSDHVGGHLNGVHWWNPSLSVTYDKWVADRYMSVDAWHVIPDFQPFDENDFVTKLMAETNPSQPHVELPVSLYELRELPSLVRSAGRGFVSSFGGNYLRYKFGIQPIVSDIKNLLDFTEEVDKRIETLTRLRDRGFIIRKAPYRTDEWEGSQDILANSQNFLVGVREKATAKREIWGYAKWQPRPFARPLPDKEIRARARRMVLGLDGPSFSALWEALPWSWLIDYFSNIGDILAANRNSLEFTCTGVWLCVTQTKTLNARQLSSSSPGISMSDFKSQVVEKYRRRAIGGLPAFTPYLTAGQTGILAALAASKSRG